MYNFGLSEIEFWRLTPAKFSAITERHDEERERQDFRAALVASTIANSVRNPKKRHQPYQPKDFMPSYGGKKAKQNKSMEMLNYWKNIVVPHFNAKASAKE